mmetsp:Transcript_3635/g.8159  ORF Transcript_3635/g.8159 Transcript_3635/m.8159 type:complete len:251 (-) Transcript_3635:1803-2555(-)
MARQLAIRTPSASPPSPPARASRESALSSPWCRAMTTQFSGTAACARNASAMQSVSVHADALTIAERRAPCAIMGWCTISANRRSAALQYILTSSPVCSPLNVTARHSRSPAWFAIRSVVSDISLHDMLKRVSAAFARASSWDLMGSSWLTSSTSASRTVPSRYRARRTVFWSEHATLNTVTTAFRRVSGLSSLMSRNSVSRTRSFLAISGTWSMSPLLRFMIARAEHCFGTSDRSLWTARHMLSSRPGS